MSAERHKVITSDHKETQNNQKDTKNPQGEAQNNYRHIIKEHNDTNTNKVKAQNYTKIS